MRIGHRTLNQSWITVTNLVGRRRRSRFRYAFAHPVLEVLEDRLALSVIYDEAVSGDLSNNQAAPTALTLALGTNSIKGSEGDVDIQDWVTVRVPSGMFLSNLVLASFVSTDEQGFLGVQRGTSFVGSPFDPASYLGYSHVGTEVTVGSPPPINLVGADLLPILGDRALAVGAQGFTPPLPSGDYTFLIQQMGTGTAYQFDFVISSTNVIQSTPTSTTLTVDPDAAVGGQLVTFTARVAPSPGAGGTVTFLDNGAPIPGAANVPLSGGIAAFSTSALAVGSHPVTAAYNGTTAFAASTSNAQTVVISSAAPQIASIILNGGLPGLAGAQHSRIINVQVAFNQAVQLDANAFTLALHTTNVAFEGVALPTGFGSLPTSLNRATTDNVTWTITFAGNTDGGADGFASLKDGVYALAIDAAKVHPLGMASVNMSAGATFVFHRLFGDKDSATGVPAGGGNDFTAIVNSGDNLAFRSAFNRPVGAGYQPFFDFNGDASINSADNLAFRSRFNKTLSWRA